LRCKIIKLDFWLHTNSKKKRIIYQNVPTEILHPNSPILIVQEVGVQTRLIGNVISHGVKSKFMKKVRRKHVDIN
jgi:hypothetical protein